jgi:RNA polymerase sigma-70 factor (ECF subfamily)
VIDRARRQSARGSELALDNENEPRIEPTQSDAIELEQTRAQYRASVEALPKRTREVFLLHRLQGLAYKEIAEQLGISIRTVE